MGLVDGVDGGVNRFYYDMEKEVGYGIVGSLLKAV